MQSIEINKTRKSRNRSNISLMLYFFLLFANFW